MTAVPARGTDTTANPSVSPDPGQQAEAHHRRPAGRAFLEARHLANLYFGRGDPFDDLQQVAVVDLIKAVDRFDADRGTDFAACPS